MTNVIRVALPGYDAMTDTNLDHFALYSDEDNILIKEKVRGSISATAETKTVAHGLSYPPFFMVYASTNIGIPVNKWCYGYNPYDSIQIWSDNTNINLRRSSGTSIFQYYIFYDNITA